MGKRIDSSCARTSHDVQLEPPGATHTGRRSAAKELRHGTNRDGDPTPRVRLRGRRCNLASIVKRVESSNQSSLRAPVLTDLESRSRASSAGACILYCVGLVAGLALTWPARRITQHDAALGYVSWFSSCWDSGLTLGSASRDHGSSRGIAMYMSILSSVSGKA